MGKFLAILILGSAILAGGGLYYMQVYGYYHEVAASGPEDVQLAPLDGGAPVPLPHDGFRAIDADSSPIRYRACFTTPLALDEMVQTYLPFEHAEPLVAPGWFDCFDASEIGAALEDGTARAFMGTPDIRYGIDRIVAVMPDGRGFVWHQINRCGEVVFDGKPAPDDCPPPPEGY